MSWSISFAGTPEQIVEALVKHSEQIEDEQSKSEYAKALPLIEGLVKLNSGEASQIQVIGNGHADDTYSYCRVSIKDHDPLV